MQGLKNPANQTHTNIYTIKLIICNNLTYPNLQTGLTCLQVWNLSDYLTLDPLRNLIYNV
ncbi:MAG: hypothetical protein CEN89_75 [Candidatus Berkelbacteria bacterium Licking1014_7]|uniref:Uncharacterized protein n=1 Tax=Candidatus Berkelbacteria bacterium Licking1014_7 TaxID=2017147 RepID=A0A554LKL0_9BACT|nr:MAG: hypothetical protein CEN89_75 [Candidatus Berkelbacteria bacterium Licking1014_7]